MPEVTEYVIDPTTGCWDWQRSRLRSGYGNVWSDGKSRRAHRVVYERHRGPIPEGLSLDHLCRNKACVNPDHLEPVTHAENCRRGVNATLDAERVREIRASSDSHGRCAKRYGVTKAQVWKIRRGLSWADVDVEAA